MREGQSTTPVRCFLRWSGVAVLGLVVVLAVVAAPTVPAAANVCINERRVIRAIVVSFQTPAGSPGR